MTTMAYARHLHRQENRKRVTETRKVPKGDGEEETVTVTKLGEKKKNYKPFRKWARENEDRFQKPYSPKLNQILSSK